LVPKKRSASLQNQGSGDGKLTTWRRLKGVKQTKARQSFGKETKKKSIKIYKKQMVLTKGTALSPGITVVVLE